MSDDLGGVLSARLQQSALLLAAYEAADPATLRRVELAEYRCRLKRCLLLFCWQAPGARLVYLPGYKLSRLRNERDSVPSARAARTSDGDRHWNARVVVLDELVGWGPSAGLPLACDHVSEMVPVPDLFAAVEGTIPGQPVRRVVPS
ncbi:MAG: hypothetical protein ACR2JO_09950 [Mycobacteriales bacterium]